MRMTWSMAVRAAAVVAVSGWMAVATGCGVGVVERGGGAAETQTGTLEGVAMGGEQPIGYSHLYLFSPGTSGYGSTSTALITVPDGTDGTGPYVLTGQYGNFSVTGRYACVPGSPVYAYISGGDTGGGNNPSVGLAGALGMCPSGGTLLSVLPFIVVNEETTVAFVNALNGYILNATHVGAPNTAQAQVGIANAVTMATTLVSPASGVAATQNAAITTFYPSDMVATVADILAACVNSQGTTFPVCSTLLSTATSDGTPTGTAASDTFVAALNIARHPTANARTLFGLQSSTPPYFSYNTTAPNDFALVIVTSSNYINNQGYGYSIALDSQGAGWLTTGNAGGLLKYSAEGSLLLTASGVTGTIDAVDKNDNVWAATFASSNLFEVSSAGVRLHPTLPSFVPGEGLAIDGTGNIWLADSADNYMFKVTPGFTTDAICCATSPFNPGYISNLNSVAIDTNGDAWGASSNAGIGSIGPLFEVDPSGLTSVSPTSGYVNSGFNTAMGVSIDAAGRVWFASNGTNTIGGYSPVSSTYVTASGGGLNQPLATAVDGLGNVWVTDSTAYLKEFSNAGVLLSGPQGIVAGYPYGRNGSVGIDPSGNLWTTAGEAVKVYVGVAAPTVTPLALGVANKTLGTRP